MAVGLVSQVSRVLSLQLVTTNIRAMARPATMASVFMVLSVLVLVSSCMTQGRRTVRTVHRVVGIHRT